MVKLQRGMTNITYYIVGWFNLNDCAENNYYGIAVCIRDRMCNYYLQGTLEVSRNSGITKMRHTTPTTKNGVIYPPACNTSTYADVYYIIFILSMLVSFPDPTFCTVL